MTGARRLAPAARTSALALAVAAGAAAWGCGTGGAPAAPATMLAAGTWGGENVGVIVGDTVAHVHVGCTLGNFPAPVRLDGSGRFSVPGSYVLRAYPIAVGPSLPARFTGTVAGDVLTLRVTVDDTVAHTTVELGPVTATLGREPRLGPCPICRAAPPFPAFRSPSDPPRARKRLVRIL